MMLNLSASKSSERVLGLPVPFVMLIGVYLHIMLLWLLLDVLGAPAVMASHALMGLLAWHLGVRRALVESFIFVVITYYMMPHFVDIGTEGMRQQGVLSAFLLLLVATVSGWVGNVFHELKATKFKLAKEHDRFETLLQGILPNSLAARVQTGETLGVDHLPMSTILFAEVMGRQAENLHVAEGIVMAVDRLAMTLGIEKVRKVGKSCLMVAGIPQDIPGHAERVARLALQLPMVILSEGRKHGATLSIRMGIHSGPLLVGVLGDDRFTLDMWGETAREASRLMHIASAGKILVSKTTCEFLQQHFECESYEKSPEAWLLQGILQSDSL